MTSSNKLKVVFFGTPEVSTYALQALINDERFSVVCVVTQPPKPIGRKQIVTSSAVQKLAENNKIAVIAQEKVSDAMDQLTKIDAELHIVVAYGQILPQKMVDMPDYGTLNIHPSLLPKWRGASPVPATILSGDTETGVCIMLMDSKMDHGPILSVQKTSVGEKTTAELLVELMKMGADRLPDVANEWSKERMTPKAQNHNNATFSKMISKQDARIDWDLPIDNIERMIRAYNPWPEAWTEIKIGSKWKKIKLLRAHIGNNKSEKILRTSSDNSRIGNLVIDELHIEGKKPMSGVDFAKTHKNETWQIK